MKNTGKISLKMAEEINQKITQLSCQWLQE